MLSKECVEAVRRIGAGGGSKGGAVHFEARARANPLLSALVAAEPLGRRADLALLKQTSYSA